MAVSSPSWKKGESHEYLWVETTRFSQYLVPAWRLGVFRPLFGWLVTWAAPDRIDQATGAVVSAAVTLRGGYTHGATVPVPGKDAFVNNWLHKWLAGVRSAYPSAFSPYWRALPIGRMRKLLMGTFFTASVVGFAIDLLQLNHQRLGGGFFWPIFGGAMAAGIQAARIKKIQLDLPLSLLMVVVGWLTEPRMFPGPSQSRTHCTSGRYSTPSASGWAQAWAFGCCCVLSLPRA